MNEFLWVVFVIWIKKSSIKNRRPNTVKIVLHNVLWIISSIFQIFNDRRIPFRLSIDNFVYLSFILCPTWLPKTNSNQKVDRSVYGHCMFGCLFMCYSFSEVGVTKKVLVNYLLESKRCCRSNISEKTRNVDNKKVPFKWGIVLLSSHRRHLSPILTGNLVTLKYLSSTL